MNFTLPALNEIADPERKLYHCEFVNYLYVLLDLTSTATAVHAAETPRSNKLQAESNFGKKMEK